MFTCNMILGFTQFIFLSSFVIGLDNFLLPTLREHLTYNSRWQ